MGTSTKIHLPHSAQSRKILEVIAKVLGMPSEIENLYKEQAPVGKFHTPRKPKPIDPSLPSSEDNPWHLEFEGGINELKVISNSSSYDALSHGSLIFKDITGHAYSWMLHNETEEENIRCINPGSHPVAVAVGLRLVKFFGGSVFYDDSRDGDAPGAKFRRSPGRAKYPPKTKEQTSNDRWHQFQNVLRAEPMLTIKELEYAATLAAYSQAETSVNLLARLKVEEERNLLDQASAPAHGTPRSGPRL